MNDSTNDHHNQAANGRQIARHDRNVLVGVPIRVVVAIRVTVTVRANAVDNGADYANAEGRQPLISRVDIGETADIAEQREDYDIDVLPHLQRIDNGKDRAAVHDDKIELLLQPLQQGLDFSFGQ